MKTTSTISPSIERRAMDLIQYKGMEPLEAVKQALIDEMDFIGDLTNGGTALSERGKIAADYLFERYNEKLSS